MFYDVDVVPVGVVRQSFEFFYRIEQCGHGALVLFSRLREVAFFVAFFGVFEAFFEQFHVDFCPRLRV